MPPAEVARFTPWRCVTTRCGSPAGPFGWGLWFYLHAQHKSASLIAKPHGRTGLGTMADATALSCSW
jgi:hypothetical protein